MGHWSFENVYSRGRQRAVLDTDLARVVIILGCLPSGDWTLAELESSVVVSTRLVTSSV